MEKFSIVKRGYDPEEVNKFLDNVIAKVDAMVKEDKEKSNKIAELSRLEKENEELRDKLARYEKMEGTLQKAIVMAEKTSEQIKYNAQHESEAILDDAKGKANRIINEALLKAEKAENEANMLKRNINIFKRRIKDIINAQIEVVDEMDEVEL